MAITIRPPRTEVPSFMMAAGALVLSGAIVLGAVTVFDDGDGTQQPTTAVANTVGGSDGAISQGEYALVREVQTTQPEIYLENGRPLNEVTATANVSLQPAGQR